VRSAITTSSMEAVPGALADSVHRALYLAGAITDGGDGVRHGEAEIIVAMDRNDGLVDVPDLFLDAPDQRPEFLGHGIADRVRDVHRAGTCFNDRFHDLVEIGNIRPRRVHGENSTSST